MKSLRKKIIIRTKNHTSFTISLIKRYNVQNLDVHRVDDIIKEFINIIIKNMKNMMFMVD